MKRDLSPKQMSLMFRVSVVLAILIATLTVFFHPAWFDRFFISRQDVTDSITLYVGTRVLIIVLCQRFFYSLLRKLV